MRRNKNYLKSLKRMVVAFDKFSGGQGTSHWPLRGLPQGCALVSQELCLPAATEGDSFLESQGSHGYCQSSVFDCGQDSYKEEGGREGGRERERERERES